MKILVDADDWYPVYFFNQHNPDYKALEQVDVSQDKLDSWEEVFKKFEEVQEELKVLYEQSRSE